MSTVRTLDNRRTSLVERLVEVANEREPGSFAERLRSRLHARSDDRQALIDLIEDLVAADEGLADVGPSIATLLRSKIAADAVTAAFAGERPTPDDIDDILTPDDVLRIARVRGQAEAAILAQPMFEASRVAAALGSSSRNPREFARQVRGRPGLVSLRRGNRFVFPSFQFNEGRQEIWPVVAEVNTVLDASAEPWAVASFWFTPDAYLGARPADLVADPARADDIRQAARRELAPVG